jgi:hypothetical protein
MSHLLATFRIVREKIIDYYNNGYNTREIIRENNSNPHTYYTKLSNFFIEPDLIYDNNNIKIYLGNSYNSANYSTLNNCNIECIINVTKEIPNYFENNFNYLNIPILDNNEDSLTNHFDDVVNYVKTNIDHGKKVFFIHCYYGASRSALIVLLILIKIFNKKMNESKEILVKNRNFTNINLKFLKELEDYLQI